jgi:amino acid adenylation domain-containing protein
VAVVFEDRQLTYRQLNRRANQLAHYLRGLGARPETPVAICVERSLEMVVGLLGILKAGGAYVPLDPAYPKERLAFMLQDAQAPVVLTQERFLAEFNNRITVCLDRDWRVISQESEENPDSGVTAENLAYAIYTSGSTGKPKGVMVPHRGLCSLSQEQTQAFDVGSSSRVLQFSSLSFDASIFEIVMALPKGATLCLGTPETLLPGPALIRLLQDQAITIVTLPPSALAALPAEKLPALRTITVAGEAYSAELIARWAPGRRFFNLYGPTETTIWATAAELHDSIRTPPIGRPIGNTQTYILDSSLRPVPIGVPGELYIGGVGLARGYLNRPELTAEKFIPNPFSREPGARLYKTGDLARYLPDGNIEFLGRIDNQVKLRGFRIELGEIEVALAKHPSVRESVVVAQEDSPGDRRLVGYVVSQQRALLTTQELRNFLKAKLPDYMVPSAFVMLETMPLTPNGKVDRRALPIPDGSRPELEEPFVAPRTPVEKVLARIWAEVLRLDRISIHDSFFDLGGHSLKAMQLASKISAAMNIDVSVKLLFAHPTVSSFAEAIGNLDAFSQRSRGAPLEPVDGAVPDARPPFSVPPDSVFMTIERRPLLSLFAAGKIAPVDAAAIGYLPDGLPEQTGLTREEIIQDWYEQLPTLTNILETVLGRIAIIGLPVFASELYCSQDGLIRLLIESLELSRKLGARMVSLTGLIPSATNYGQAIRAAMADGKDLPKITTGHANTTATVVLTIERILKEAGRDLAQERVGFLGLGSIGVTTLRLMLRCLPYPREIVLCDVYDRRDLLIKIREEIASALGFHGLVRVVPTEQSVPAEFYDATLIVGATNVPEIIDIEAVRPGTIVVDDSGPHCFSVGRTVKRFQKHEDILFTEGGTLQSPHPMRRLRYLPRFVEKRANSQYVKTVFAHNPFQITGCVLSGLLSSRFQELVPTIGLVDDSSCLQHYKLLCQLGFQAAELHCRDFVLPDESIRNFRRRFPAVKGTGLP